MQQVPDFFDFSAMTAEEVVSTLKQYHIGLAPTEAKTIQEMLLKRPPSFAECVLWSIQGSEHCSYKSSRTHLKTLITSGPQVILGPKEDAGIVSVATDHAGRRYGIVMSHESHNHPSQIVPYEGAATGVGGNVRDVSCMGAEVIAVADGLRFGDKTLPRTASLLSGVVSGIAGYGNPLGIPNLAGDLYFDPGYNDNCLVTVVTLGIVREDHVIHSEAPKNAAGYVYILVGKPTDNSGFGGASFASTQLEEGEVERNKGAVQEPNAFLQRHILKANNALFKILREENLLDQVGFKDLGAGGIACASVELADAGGYGAEVDLDAVPVSMPHLLPAVVLCSETQERFMWVVSPELAPRILVHYNETFALPMVSKGARAAIIGKIRTDGQYVVKAQGQVIVEAKASDITRGILYDRPYTEKMLSEKEPDLAVPNDYNAVLLDILVHENVASRAPIFEKYDKQVQGRTFIERGLADCGVMQPFNDDSYPEEIRATGIALSLDQNPRYNKINPYLGAVNAVIKSVRNVTAVGATPVALTDCLCFGNPEKETQMGELVAAIRGIRDASAAIHLAEFPEAPLPVISGNVSLYNETNGNAIPASPMISCLGVLPDVHKTVTYDFKTTSSLLFMVGARKNECGGSLYYALQNVLGANVPQPDLREVDREIHAVFAAIQQGLVLSCHDIAEGGIAAAIAEMSFKRDIGVNVRVPADLRTDITLFTETGGFIFEVLPHKAKALQTLFAEKNILIFAIGETMATPYLRMNGVIDIPIQSARDVWQAGLRGGQHE